MARKQPPTMLEEFWSYALGRKVALQDYSPCVRVADPAGGQKQAKQTIGVQLDLKVCRSKTSQNITKT